LEAEPVRTPARVGAAALLLAASVLVSRALAYVREAVLAYQVGAGPEVDAYRAAFQLPDLLNYLLAGSAFSIAFLPLYARTRDEGGEAAAERLAATVLGTTAVLAVVVTLVLWVFAAPITAFQFSGFDPARQALTTHLTRIVLPAQVFFVTGGILKAVLMAHGRFGAQAAAPIVYNLGIIAGGLALGPGRGVEGFAWGALIGACVASLAIPLVQARRHLRLRARFAPLDPQFLRYVTVAAPLIFGLSLFTLDEWYQRWFGAQLAEGSVARIGYARQLMLVPVAVVGQAIATAALPAFSGLASQRRHDDLAALVLRTLQSSVGLALLSGAAVLVLARPLVELVYRRGAFSSADADAVAGLLQILCLATPAWVTQQVAVRAFYARGDTWRPMLLGTVFALASIPLYLGLSRRMGAEGLAVAAAISISANALATLLLARRLHGAPALGALAGSLARAAAVAGAAGGAAHFALRGSDGSVAAFVDLCLGGGAFMAVALLGIALIGDAPQRELLRRARALPGGIARRLRPAAGA
jgi:putative peptidoglycan lipid II flippase